MADRWYDAVGEKRRAPVEKVELLRMMSWYFVLGVLTQELDEIAADRKKASAA